MTEGGREVDDVKDVQCRMEKRRNTREREREREREEREREREREREKRDREDKVVEWVRMTRLKRKM